MSVDQDVDAIKAERDAAVALLRECRTIMAEMDEGWPTYLCGAIDTALGARQPKVAPPDAVPVATAPMTAERAAFFMERFRREEKLLGPNEQAAIDFVIAMLDAAPPEPAPQAAPDLLAALQGMVEAYGRAGPWLTREERDEDRQRLITARAAITAALGAMP